MVNYIPVIWINPSIGVWGARTPQRRVGRDPTMLGILESLSLYTLCEGMSKVVAGTNCGENPMPLRKQSGRLNS